MKRKKDVTSLKEHYLKNNVSEDYSLLDPNLIANFNAKEGVAFTKARVCKLY